MRQMLDELAAKEVQRNRGDNPAVQQRRADPALRADGQSEVWRSVGLVQRQLSANLAAPVESEKSRTSLQLSLEADALKPIADAACPACGSPPVASSVVGWPKAHNARFCTCSLCNTHWNVVRVKCVLCGETGSISYHTVEGQPDETKAETCSSCNSYVKIHYQVNNHLLEPFADDVATLGLDLLMREEGVTRGGRNLFLLGY